MTSYRKRHASNYRTMENQHSIGILRRRCVLRVRFCFHVAAPAHSSVGLPGVTLVDAAPCWTVWADDLRWAIKQNPGPAVQSVFSTWERSHCPVVVQRADPDRLCCVGHGLVGGLCFPWPLPTFSYCSTASRRQRPLTCALCTFQQASSPSGNFFGHPRLLIEMTYRIIACHHPLLT